MIVLSFGPRKHAYIFTWDVIGWQLVGSLFVKLASDQLSTLLQLQKSNWNSNCHFVVSYNFVFYHKRCLFSFFCSKYHGNSHVLNQKCAISNKIEFISVLVSSFYDFLDIFLSKISDFWAILKWTTAPMVLRAIAQFIELFLELEKSAVSSLKNPVFTIYHPIFSRVLYVLSLVR